MNPQYQPEARFGYWKIGLLLVLCMATIIAMYAVPGWTLSSDMLPAAIIGNLVVGLLCLFAGRNESPHTRQNSVLFFLWWVMLSSEEFFVRWNETESTLEGRFSPEAFAEASIWVLVFFGVAVLTLKDTTYLRWLWKSPYKWLTLYGGVCLLSAGYAIKKSYSLAWAFKLVVVILLLEMCANRIRDERQMAGFLRATLWGLAFLTLVPPVRALFYAGPVFEDGRLGTTIAPTGLSAIAGTLFLTTLAVAPVVRSRWVAILAVLSVGVLFLAGGKMAMVAGVLSAILYFLMQRRVFAAIGVFAGVLTVGGLVIAVTPVSSYLTAYLKSDSATTLTGRTGLWELAWPYIQSSPLLGFGYASSRFISDQVGGVVWDPGHMHNGFLEALYNNGLFGLALVLMLHAAILANLFRVIRYTDAASHYRQVAIGCIALYMNIVLNGLFNASFGGRAGGTFIVLLALVMVSERLVFLVRRTNLVEPQVEILPPVELAHA